MTPKLLHSKDDSKNPVLVPGLGRNYGKSFRNSAFPFLPFRATTVRLIICPFPVKFICSEDESDVELTGVVCRYTSIRECVRPPSQKPFRTHLIARGLFLDY